jgi:hypothetical protein
MGQIALYETVKKRGNRATRPRAAGRKLVCEYLREHAPNTALEQTPHPAGFFHPVSVSSKVGRRSPPTLGAKGYGTIQGYPGRSLDSYT